MAGAFKKLSNGQKLGSCLLGTAIAGGTAVAFCFERTIKAATDADRYAHPPHMHWPHSSKHFGAFDVRSIRRGYEVYKQVCASCHSLHTVRYRMLRNVLMTPEEAKAEAARITVLDGPGDDGEMFERPGKTIDRLPKPYPNNEAAAYANGGKAPPDLTYITFARNGYENYIFALLTGYQDPPAGYQLEEGLYFNPYFHGGAIAMPPPLYNEVLEYTDGTPASMSQTAKDVACFLRWTAEPWHDEQKKISMKVMTLMLLATACSIYYNRHIWSVVKTMKTYYQPLRKR